jgi:hypothetical protein
MSQQLIYILLGVIFLIFIVVTIRDWMVQRRRNQQTGHPVSRSGEQEETLSLRLHAYERLVVFMERARMENLFHRVYEPELTAADVRRLIVHAIQSEYEYNLSQQIYVSAQAWEAVTNAKEQVVSQVNTLADRLPRQAEGKALGKLLLEWSLQEEESPVHTALQMLNAEARGLMR